MAIDDPVDRQLRILREEVEDSSYLPLMAARLGMSASIAAALSANPFISQILTSLLAFSPRRFQRRFVLVLEALAERQKQVAADVPNPAYYESEEFHSLLTLILERLHSTYQQEKLKTFGEALANSGTKEFATQDNEPFVRTLRDLSLEDLQILRRMSEIRQRPAPLGGGRVRKGESPGMSRLASLGLLQESTQLRDFTLNIPTVPLSRQSPEVFAEALGKAFGRYFKEAAMTTYRISGFGEQFLRFVASTRADAPPDEALSHRPSK